MRKLLFKLWLWYHGIKEKDLDSIREEYISSLKITSKQENPYFIGMLGLIGCGKTTLAKEIEKELPVTLLNSDNARRMLEDKKYPLKTIKLLTKTIGLKVIFELLKKKINLLLDEDLTFPKEREIIENELKKYGYKFYLIKVNCPKEIILERLNKRLKDEKYEYFKKDIMKKFYERKKLHLKHPIKAFFEFDTTKPLRKQVLEFKRRLLSSV